MSDFCYECPRRCGVNRTNQKGFCGVSKEILVAKACLHPWEEPVISGERGSGTVFFSGCNLSCVFCQNAAISRKKFGKIVSSKTLTGIFLWLEAQGAASLNLVTPSHYALELVEPLREAKKEGLSIPVCFNTSGYDLPETLEKLSGLVDIYLTDYKYADHSIAGKYSKCPDYPQVVISAIDAMLKQTGPWLIEDGLMKRGVLVRHLALPGQAEDSKKVLQTIWIRWSDQVFLSLLNQYTPLYDSCCYPELQSRISKQAYEELIDFAWQLGFREAFVQEEPDESIYTPIFDLEGLDEE